MRYKPSKFVSIFQRAAFVALCFIASAAQATTYCSANVGDAYALCNFYNGGDCRDASHTITYSNSNICSGGESVNTVRLFYSIYGDNFYARLDNGWHSPSYTDPEDYDEDGCFTGSGGNLYCPGDPFYQDADGYGSDGCIPDTELCPGDEGWYDADGYDHLGFDSEGLDRGGNTAAEGGGYYGHLGSGGSPPEYLEPPYPVDPQNGNNRDSYSALQCWAAYPVTVSKSLLPSSVQDGLAGCSNECVYQPAATLWDFTAQEEIVSLVPTGQECTSEPSISVVDIMTYYAPPMGEEPPSEFDNINACYLNGGYFYCDHPLDPDPPECYRNVSGWLGTSINCQEANENPETCGYVGSVYHCIDSASNCQSYNGVFHCIDAEGNYIALNDPDHIINGGNGDGDPTNDVFADSTDVDNNGQSTADRISQALDARELAREIDERLADNFSALLGAIESQDLSELTAGSQGEAESDSSGFLDSIAGVGTDEDLTFDGSIIDPITNLVGGIIPAAGSCQTFTYDYLPSKGYSLELNTCNLSIVQPLLTWVVYALTLLTLYNLAVGNRGSD